MRIPNFGETELAVAANCFQQTSKWKVNNRTGAPTAKYFLYVFDTRLITPLETVANAKGAMLPAVVNYSFGDDGAFGNIINPYLSVASVSGTYTESLANSTLIYCVSQQAVADNETLDVIVVGETPLVCTTAGFGAAPGTIDPWSRVLGGTNTGIVTLGNAFTLSKVIAMTIAATFWGASNSTVPVNVFFNGINGTFGP